MMSWISVSILVLLCTLFVTKCDTGNDISDFDAKSIELNEWMEQAKLLQKERINLHKKELELNEKQEILGKKLDTIKVNNPDIKINENNKESSILSQHKMDWTVVSTKGFWSSLTMIIISELGDKTFFIAAILAMKNSRVIVWLGAAGALFAMTVIAVVFGTFLQTLPTYLTHYGAALLFLGFGIKLLYDASKMKSGEASDELREAEEELLKDDALNKKEDSPDLELHDIDINKKNKHKKKGYNIGILIKAFTMTFISEIGDRSQIATIVLASHKNPYGVCLGASVGHGICTGIAVLGGKLLAAKISEKNVTLIGGVLFMFFALESFIFGPSV